MLDQFEELFTLPVSDPVEHRRELFEQIEEAIDDRNHTDRFTEPFHAGLETADSANIQTNFHACLRRHVECVDNLFVDQRIDFRGDLSANPSLGTFGFDLDQFQK